MVRKEFTFSGHGGTALAAVVWLPEGEIRAVVQITHGMTEHMGRYGKLAEALTSRGIAAAGFDLRGHGRNPGNRDIASMGQGGWAASIEDMRLFFGFLRQRFPEKPICMLGFSLGSFLLREYLGRYPEGVDGAVIMGTGHQPGWLLSVMLAIVGGQLRKAGFDGTTDLIRRLSFGTYNQKFIPNRTEADWLCADESALAEYLADPLVRRDVSAGLFRDLLASMKRTGNPGAYRTWNQEMPVLLLSGQDDPVGDGSRRPEQISRRMKQAGIRNVEFELVPGARHDLLHEENSGAETARRRIVQWLCQRME